MARESPRGILTSLQTTHKVEKRNDSVGGAFFPIPIFFFSLHHESSSSEMLNKVVLETFSIIPSFTVKLYNILLLNRLFTVGFLVDTLLY